MSKQICELAFQGASTAVGVAEQLLDKAIEQYGAEAAVNYPDTAYRLPIITALSGEDAATLGELVPILTRIKDNNLRPEPELGNALFSGEATLYAAEVIEALRYVGDAKPDQPPYTGFLPDPILRKFGVPLVDGTIPGVAVVTGKAKDAKAGAKLIKDLQSKGMLVMLVNDIIEQCIEENIKVGIDYLTLPLGKFTQIIHAVNFAVRAGLTFGGVPKGERQKMLDYQQRRVPAFVIALGELDAVTVAIGAGALFMGFPIVSDQALPPELQISGLLEAQPDYDKIVKLILELRGIKLKIVDIPVPITVGPAFEGETIRKQEAWVEFGGGRSAGFELVRMLSADQVEDGEIEVIGPEIDDMAEGSVFPLGIIVDIYGSKMQQDFEGVLERRIHYFINYGEGLWHVAQRDLCWLRISKGAKAAGFTIRHLGELLIAKFKSDYPAIVDRVKVTLITDAAVVEEKISMAREIYQARDARLKDLNDESVDTFYSCTLCQSFAPNHVCIVSPERVGLCGAVSWLDAKASNEITPTGPNQPIEKGECLDGGRGMWQNVNNFLYNASNRTLEEVNLYTVMDKPMTSCGCFEAIVAVLPMCNGVMITTREHSGDTPCGMSFSTLAGTCGGGVQTPGFMGIGRRYIISSKFIIADGGLGRVVWMPQELKEYLKIELTERAAALGLGADFIDKIADETVGTTEEEILPFLEEKQHPALTMPSLI